MIVHFRIGNLGGCLNSADCMYSCDLATLGHFMWPEIDSCYSWPISVASILKILFWKQIFSLNLVSAKHCEQTPVFQWQLAFSQIGGKWQYRVTGRPPPRHLNILKSSSRYQNIKIEKRKKLRKGFWRKDGETSRPVRPPSPSVGTTKRMIFLMGIFCFRLCQRE